MTRPEERASAVEMNPRRAASKFDADSKQHKQTCDINPAGRRLWTSSFGGLATLISRAISFNSDLFSFFLFFLSYSYFYYHYFKIIIAPPPGRLCKETGQKNNLGIDSVSRSKIKWNQMERRPNLAG